MKFCSPACAADAGRKHELRVFNGVPYHFNSATGYYVSRVGGRMNRAVWEFYNGPVPKGHVVHHRDEDKANDSIDNLELMEWGEHTRHHHAAGVTKSAIKADTAPLALCRAALAALHEAPDAATEEDR